MIRHPKPPHADVLHLSGYEPLSLEEAERSHIQRTLTFTQWNKLRASLVLGISRSTLQKKIKQHGITAKGESNGRANLGAVGYEPVSLRELDRFHIQRTLALTNWDKAEAVSILKIERSTLEWKIKQHGLIAGEKDGGNVVVPEKPRSKIAANPGGKRLPLADRVTILATLEECNGQLTHTAGKLGMTRAALLYQLRKVEGDSQEL
jgi:DNA-binding NtrC family response regulator